MKANKRRWLKNVSLVALSAVMVSGVALAAAGCGNNGNSTVSNPEEISVYIFCNKADEHTNNTICRKWEKEYEAKTGQPVKVDLTVNYDKAEYFSDLSKRLNGGRNNIQDIIYLSPKYVQSYAKAGTVMDLTDYLTTDAQAVQNIGGIWSNAISYYGNSTAASYSPGQQIEYRADGANGAGFYTTSGSDKVGIYGLPKDYSNFSMGYNKKYFSDAMKKAYETTKGSTARKVKSASKTTVASKLEYEGYTGKNDNVATFAASGDYTLSDGTTAKAVEGQEAPLIAVGVPVTYKPFNFYRYATFTEALNAGDPMACATDEFTAGGGYTVTLPGFPGDTFEITDQANAKATNVPYDASLGHTVFTYAEYGALVWAVTYYLNTFDWDSSTPTQGAGGLTISSGQQAIYGSEQYEGTQGNALYLLPWLASNDADLINSNSTKCSNGVTLDANKSAYEIGGTNSEDRAKLNLDGTTRNAKVQYGMDSKNFMETYGAYQEFGSTWNGNSGNAGDTDTTKTASGWDYFRMGAAVFYGAGTWDAATRNDTKMDVFEFGQMPTPVSERLALYTETKDANYDPVTYSNNEKVKGTGDSANGDYDQRSALSSGKKVYTKTEIENNQIKRQDKWAARMDSVGYAANGRLAELTSDSNEYWKKAAAPSLIAALTVGREEQVTLTYAGAQLPNFIDQCSDFLYYQDEAYADKSFKDMLTPDGFADTPAGEGRAVWDYYYQVALALAADSLTGSSKRDLTVKQWVEQSGYGHYKAGAPKGEGALRYDEQYADVVLKDFAGGNDTNIAFAMKVLRMVCFTYAERDLNIRMQYGLNSVRDASMYTEKDTWLGTLNGGGQSTLLAYINQRELSSAQKQAFGNKIAHSITDSTLSGANRKDFWTPALYCLTSASAAQNSLNTNS